MCKTDIYNAIAKVVVSVTEVDYQTLCTTAIKTREVVDARYIFIYVLHTAAGFDSAYIAKRLNMTPQGVRLVLSQFNLRQQQSGKFFEILLHKITNTLEIA